MASRRGRDACANRRIAASTLTQTLVLATRDGTSTLSAPVPPTCAGDLLLKEVEMERSAFHLCSYLRQEVTKNPLCERCVQRASYQGRTRFCLAALRCRTLPWTCAAACDQLEPDPRGQTKAAEGSGVSVTAEQCNVGRATRQWYRADPIGALGHVSLEAGVA